MLFIGVLFALVDSASLQRRVAGGYTVDSQLYKFMVRVYANIYEDCGGARYSSNVVLTAAHCSARPAEEYTVFSNVTKLSDSFSDPNVVKFNVSEIFVHPDYKYRTIANSDIAVMKLDASFSTEKLIELDSTKKDPEVGTPAFLVGWGYMFDQHGFPHRPEYLQEVELDAVSKTDCANQYYIPYNRKKEEGISKTYKDSLTRAEIVDLNTLKQDIHVCFSKPGEVKGGVSHDSGGPIFSKNPDTLISLLSFVDCKHWAVALVLGPKSTNLLTGSIK